MVSILIVSHSKEIAAGTKKLAEQMKQGDVEILAVGGTKEGEIGTDPDAIYSSLKKINKEDGVIVLADLGSAVMNINMIIDRFDEDIKKKIILADAPIVEGAVFATVEASVGEKLSNIVSSIETPNVIKKKQ